MWTIALLCAAWLVGELSPLRLTAQTAPATRPALYSPPVQADVARYRELITALASDPMEGRGVGTKGLVLARDYIAEHFEKIGLKSSSKAVGGATQPAKAAYLQPLQIRAGTVVKEAKLAAAGADGKLLEFERGKDFVVMGLAAAKAIEAQVVYVGYGVKSDQHKYDSYATDGKPAPKDALKGKIAVCWRYEPMSDKKQSKWGQDGSWVQARLNSKAGLAAAHGAIALLYVNPPTHEKEPLQPPPDAAALSLPIPLLHISPATFKALLGKAGRAADDEALRQLQADADAGKTGPLALDGVKLSMSMQFQNTTAEVHNVAAVLPGAGKLADEYIFVGAHYDHLGQTGSGDARRIFYGADDNASGTAGVLLLAERLARHAADGKLPAERRSVFFTTFAAEERGLLGSRHMVKRLDELGVKPEQIVAMLNIDMIGRMRNDSLMVGGVASGDRWDALLDAASKDSPVKTRRSASGYGASDHSSFYSAKVPVLFFGTGIHPELHTPRDTLATINFDGAVRSVNVIDGVLRQLLDARQRIAYVAPKPGQNPIGGMMRRGAYLGLTPGDPPGELKGVAIDTLIDDGPAAKAGLKAGDVITKLGDTDIASLADLQALLAKCQGGEKVKVWALRGEEPISAEITLGKR
jgi:hypothetical protein